jgi:Domain of unknown function (DUF4263)
MLEPLIIEIRRPTTELLSKHQYRPGVYAASSEPAGLVSQILDQRYHLQRSFLSLKDSREYRDVQAYAVDCVLIAGGLPDVHEEDRVKCFELKPRGVLQVDR